MYIGLHALWHMTPTVHLKIETTIKTKKKTIYMFLKSRGFKDIKYDILNSQSVYFFVDQTGPDYTTPRLQSRGSYLRAFVLVLFFFTDSFFIIMLLSANNVIIYHLGIPNYVKHGLLC